MSLLVPESLELIACPSLKQQHCDTEAGVTLQALCLQVSAEENAGRMK